jgi:hypothetical protein
MAAPSGSGEVDDRTKTRIKESFVGPDSETVGHTGYVIAQDSHAGGSIISCADDSVKAFRQKPVRRLIVFQVRVAESCKDSFEDDFCFALELVERGMVKY